jgi:formylglycine-generating enzyme required for sulfatase activity
VDYQERIDALRPLFEKPSSPLSIEPETAKPEDKVAAVEQPLSSPEQRKPPELQPSIEVVRSRPAQAPAPKEHAVEKQLNPVQAAREYVEKMRPVPPDAPRFYMSPCLVSNELYFCFLRENSDWLKAEGNADSNYLKHWTKGEPRAEDLRLPVTNISFRAAKAFAEWLSELSYQKIRLPKLGEWQIAASAGQSRWFEEAIAAGRVNYFGTANHLHAVDAFKPNPYGIRDLIGQAFDMTFLDDDSFRPAVVGGCYHNTEEQLRASLHGEELKSDKICPPDSSFRCVLSA